MDPKWRLLDTGRRPASENIALDSILLEAMSKGDIPNTLRFLQFDPPSVLIGYHQTIEHEVRVDYCRRRKIDINRRITGGGQYTLIDHSLAWRSSVQERILAIDWMLSPRRWPGGLSLALED